MVKSRLSYKVFWGMALKPVVYRLPFWSLKSEPVSSPSSESTSPGKDFVHELQISPCFIFKMPMRAAVGVVHHRHKFAWSPVRLL